MASRITFLFVVCVVALCTGTVSAQLNVANWTVVRPNLASIIGDIAFDTVDHGYIGAFISGPGPLLLETDDGLEHLYQENPGFSPIIYWDVAVSDSKAAVCAGVTIPGKGAALYLDQSTGNWTQSETVLAGSTFSEVQSLGGADFRMVGAWTMKNSDNQRVVSNGVASSSDGGRTWSFASWPFSDLSPNSASWVDSNTAYVSGGQLPAPPADDSESDAIYQMTHGCQVRDGSVHYTQPEMTNDPAELERQLTEARQQHAAVEAAANSIPLNETFRAVLVRTTDGGNTWETLINETSVTNSTGMTITSVEFVNANVGFITGEIVVQGFPVAFMNKTTDGGKTWVPVYAVPAGFLLKVKMYNETFGFAVGGAPNPNGIFSFGLVLNTTDGGKTWQESLIPKFITLNNVNIVDGTHAYAVGIQSWQLASILKYQPISELEAANAAKAQAAQAEQEEAAEDLRLELEEEIAQLQAELDTVVAFLTHFNPKAVTD